MTSAFASLTRKLSRFQQTMATHGFSWRRNIYILFRQVPNIPDFHHLIDEIIVLSHKLAIIFRLSMRDLFDLLEVDLHSFVVFVIFMDLTSMTL